MMRSRLLILLFVAFGCAARAPQRPFAVDTLGGKTLWLPAVRNGTDADLRLPGTNPLRSLGEMAGKIAPDYRPTVMDLLRASIQRELEQRKVRVRFPEEHDARFTVLPLGPEAAARIARASSSVFVSRTDSPTVRSGMAEGASAPPCGAAMMSGRSPATISM